MSRISLVFERNDGKRLTVNDTVWGIVGIKGLDKPDISVFTQKAAIGDGDYVTGSRVGARTLEFTLKAKSAALNDVMRRAATSFFTIGRTYDIYVTRHGAPRYAPECRLTEFEIPTEKITKPITMTVEMLCPDGYFLSNDSFAKNIAGIEPRCGYPYVSHIDYGRIYGIYSFAETVYLDNDGDVEAYCKAVITAAGEIINPKLIAGDGFVRVLGSMLAGDVLIIDGKEKSVTLNGANISNQIDRASSFDGIVFGVGTNAIGYGADVGSNVMNVYVYYNKRYMGA